MNKLLLLCRFTLCLFISGCAPKFIVEIDSLSAPAAKEKTSYVLVPGNKDCSKLDLQYIEFESHADKVLQDLGFKKASNSNPAEVAIMLYYGISDPQIHEYTYSVPVYGQTGTTTSTTYNYGGITTSHKPSYGVVGSSTHVGTDVIFKSYLTLTATDIEHYDLTNETKTLWKTHITSVGEIGDLRILFPIILAGAKNHIATDTGQIIKIELKVGENKRQAKIKRSRIER